MVNKMSLKFCLFTVLFTGIIASANAADVGFSAIKQRHRIICGIDIDYPYLAKRQDKDLVGFDADMCRAFALSILQDADSFTLLPVKSDKIGSALNSGKIDVMLGHNELSSPSEAQNYITPVDTIYYDRLVFAARQKKEGATSMKDFAGSKVCVEDNSPAYDYLVRYNTKYALGFSYIKFPYSAAVKEAFYLRRCELLAGDEVFVTSAVKDLHNDEAQVLPEEFGITAVKYYVSAANNTLAIALRSVINALKMTGQMDINSTNLITFKSDSTPSVQNMIGADVSYWQKLGLSPDWLNKYVETYGNYNDLIERGFGNLSPLKIDGRINQPYSQGGMIVSRPLL